MEGFAHTRIQAITRAHLPRREKDAFECTWTDGFEFPPRAGGDLQPGVETALPLAVYRGVYDRSTVSGVPQYSSNLSPPLSMRFLSTLAASIIGTLIAFAVVVFFLFFFVFALTLSTDQEPVVQSGSVLNVPIEGSIPERVSQDPFQQAFGGGPDYDLRDLQISLRNAASDDRVEAVWLRLKGTTAGWGTLEEVRQAVVQARDSGLPVVASSADFGMSEKDYFLASAADSIFVGPQSFFEYNGFVTTLAFFQNTLDDLGVEPQLIRAGRYKSAGERFVREDLSEPNREQISALLETVNDRFFETVGAARDRSVDTLERLATEEAFLDPSVAVEEGLVDGIRYRDEMRETLRSIVGGSAAEDLSTVDVGSYRRVSAEGAGVSYTGTGQVDVVYAEGTIVTGDPGENPLSPSGEVLGSATLIDALESARTNSNTKGVVLRVNSPGGSAAASEAMWRAVERTAAEKPVIVSMGDVAASGGYYLAAGADSIVANPTTTTGSIGVFGLLMNAESLFEDHLGITFDGVSTSPYADMFSSVKPLDQAERRVFGRTIDQTYQTFLRRVADGRGMEVAAVDSVAQGRVWSGRDAGAVGLVDTSGTLQDAIAMAGRAAELGEGPYRTRVLPQPQTLFERLNEQFAMQVSHFWRSLTTTSLEQKLWRHSRVVQRMVGTNGTVQTRLPFEPTIE